MTIAYHNYPPEALGWKFVGDRRYLTKPVVLFDADMLEIEPEDEHLAIQCGAPKDCYEFPEAGAMTVRLPTDESMAEEMANALEWIRAREARAA